MPNVDLSRVPEYYHNYINQVTDSDLDMAFRKHQSDFVSVLKNIPPEKWNYRYAEGKWSVKEVVQHIIDAERIFCYRALRFARKDQTPLPSFDENSFAATSKANQRNEKELIEELQTVQKSSAQLFASFDGDQLDSTGIASKHSIYVKAIGYIIVGHSVHHKNILLERYLK